MAEAGLWRVLAMHAGSNADAVRALTFFGVEAERIVAPVMARRRPDASGRQVRVRVGDGWRWRPAMREIATPIFPGYLFVRCDDPVQCGTVDWAINGRGALLRAEPLAAPTVISSEWVLALRTLCQRDSQGRMRVSEAKVAALTPTTARGDDIHKALRSGKWMEARMISGPFEGEVVKIEPVISPDALVDALQQLDERGALRIVMSMFGSRRSLVVPREQVEVVGECMPDCA